MPNHAGHPLTVDEFSDHNATLLSRQRISRRTLIKGALTGAGAVALTQFPFAQAAFAAGGGVSGPSGVVLSGRHLSWVPDADGNPTSSMKVTAQVHSAHGTLPKGLRAFVDIGDAPGRYGTHLPAEIVNLVGMYAIPNGPVGNQFYVKATMSGLSAGKVYHYRLRLSDGTVTGDAYFTTAPSRKTGGTRRVPQAFTFTAFADVGTNIAPVDPQYAWNKDPAVVTDAGGTWPRGVFDNNYYSPTDPVAGTGGTDPTPANTLTQQMASQRPVFTLLAGDICYADPSGSGLPADDSLALTGTSPVGANNYNPYVWDVFLNQIESQSAFTPWMFATGNHDMEPLYGNTEFLGGRSGSHGYAGHKARLDLPDNGPKNCPSVYKFVYDNVGVISVDANDLSYEIQTNTGYSDGAQLKFLENTLRTWRQDRSVDFIVAFFHHCAYSTTNQHASDGGVRGALDPLFSKYQVDLAVQGHNHIFERTDPIKNGHPTRQAPDGSTITPATDGCTYITVGSGGRPRYQFRPAPSAAAPAPAGVTPYGPQTLPEGQRYRGYQPAGGPNSAENNTENVVNSYVWSSDGTAVNASGYPQGTKIPEVIDWSQVRYDDYAFIAVDVKPAAPGRPTTMTIRTLADSLPGTASPLTEIDRITFSRVAGNNRVLATPGSAVAQPGPAADGSPAV
ncbi:purple acid phosphatase family protein [Jatrophihabitans sp. YIM 134969]